jgi:hypothetical protein
MVLSKQKAIAFFKERALPRRTLDKREIDKYSKENSGKKKNIYRRVSPDEINRGEPYPLCHDGIKTYAHFGIGIGIYFSQLVILIIVTFVCGCIMIIAANEYQSSSFGQQSDEKSAAFCATCPSTNITATSSCPDDQSTCIIDYRPNCNLPFNAAVADLTMCAIFVLTIYLSKFLEKRIEKDLDDTIQTATDYSVVVMDPDEDADNPEEWYNYFSDFGTVRYITLVRRNTELMSLVLQKHKISKELLETSSLSSSSVGFNNLRKRTEQSYKEISKQLEELLEKNKSYPVCRVYVTFEDEDDASNCLAALKIPDLYSRFDIKEGMVNPKYFFRQTNVLKVKEPPEPDNILWFNVELKDHEKYYYRFFSTLLSVMMMIACWFIVQYTRAVSPLLMAVVIGIVDSALPTIFFYFTNFGVPQSEGSRQYSIQMRLFLARFLISVIIPYFQTPWNAYLTNTEIAAIVSVQFFTCFTAPVLALTDYVGLFMRHCYSFGTSNSQDELNLQWLGSDWSLAEKYTGLAKVLSVCLFYAIFSPLSILLSTIAFLFIFCVDNYLLFRRWKSTAMLDGKIASRLRRQAVLCIFAHMYATLRFIYSWPMDETYIDPSTGLVSYVNKQPPYAFWNLSPQEWHSEGQAKIFNKYKTGVFIVGCIAFFMFLIEPGWKAFKDSFCFTLRKSKINEDTGTLDFSELEKVKIYYPLLFNSNSGDSNDITYLCSYSKNILPQHLPHTMTSIQHFSNVSSENQTTEDKLEGNRQASSVTRDGSMLTASAAVIPTSNNEQEEKGLAKKKSAKLYMGGDSTLSYLREHPGTDDLSFYIPTNRQFKLLSIVQYYPDEYGFPKESKIKKQQFCEDVESAPTKNNRRDIKSSKMEVGYSSKNSHYSERALSTVQARKGFSMIYLHFELACQSIVDYVSQYDDYLWEAADHLIESRKVKNTETNQPSRKNQIMPSSESDDETGYKGPQSKLNALDEKAESQKADHFHTLTFDDNSAANPGSSSSQKKTKITFSDDNARAEPKSNSFGSAAAVTALSEKIYEKETRILEKLRIMTAGSDESENKAWPEVELAEPKSFRSPNDKLAKGDKQHKKR